MTPSCQHWSPHPAQFAGSCAIKEADGVPSYRYCAEFCKKWQGDGQAGFRRRIEAELDARRKRLQPPLETFGPGGLLHKLIEACGYKPKPGCGCQNFAHQMNEWGWVGCATTHRQEIVDWLVAQAKRSGVELSSETVVGLVRAALQRVKQINQNTIHCLSSDTFQPGVTLITPTKDRPEAFALLERWMSKQTVRWDQWVVVTDSAPPNLTLNQQLIRTEPVRGNSQMINLCAALNHTKFDKVLFIEDDDWYSPHYIERMMEWLTKADLVGAWRVRWYEPTSRTHGGVDMSGRSWVCLCRTGMTAKVYPAASHAILAKDAFDIRLWANWRGSKLRSDTNEVLHVGFKNMPGTANGANGARFCRHIDNELVVLRSWIGADADAYAKFSRAHFQPLNLKTSVVLVGNGPSAVSSELGGIIDSYQEVVRFNNYLTKGLEKFVGSKTTLWATTGRQLSPQDKTMPPAALVIHERAILSCAVDKVNRIPFAYYNEIQNRVQQRSRRPDSRVLLPSTGLLTILFLLEKTNCKQVDLVGFDHFAKQHDRRHHYWVAAAYRQPREHDGVAESEILAELEAAGKVRYLVRHGGGLHKIVAQPAVVV